MEKDVAMEFFLKSTTNILNQLVGFGKKIVNDVIVEMVLNALP
jgi:hypothetical protein